MKVYVVRIGGRLYLDRKGYGLFQSTTANITRAYLFEDYLEAEKMAKKAINAEVIEYNLSESGSFDDNEYIVELERRILVLTEQKNDLLEINKSYKALLERYKNV